MEDVFYLSSADVKSAQPTTSCDLFFYNLVKYFISYNLRIKALYLGILSTSYPKVHFKEIML